jgi:hypothetical protein
MEFEKEVKKIVDTNYGGDVDKFLSSIKIKTIMFLSLGGLVLLLSMFRYKSIGVIISPMLIIGIFSMIIGMLYHFMYNESYKALK